MKLILENWREFLKQESSYHMGEAKDIDKIAKAIIVKNDQALILLRTDYGKYPNRWDLPGGHLQEGESLVEGLAREVREETGLDIKDVENLNLKVGNHHFFKAEMPDQEIRLSDEHTDYKLVSAEEVPENISDKYRNAIEQVLSPNLKERDYQKDSENIKGYVKDRKKYLDTGANKEDGGGEGIKTGTSDKRSKSKPPILPGG